MSKKYPEYDSYDIGGEECFKLYAKKLKKILKQKDKHFKYPLDKKHVYVADVGRTRTDSINPCLFVKLALPKSHIRKCSLPYIMDAYEYGIPKLDPVFFNISDDCKIWGHQGRHRAQVACDLGINKIPILLKYSDYVYKQEKNYGDMDKMREVSKLLVNEENDWENLNKYKDNFIYPNECSIDKLKTQQLGAVRMAGYTPEGAIEERERLRDKYKITEIIKNRT